MFAQPAQLLRTREGTLSEVPLPLLLHAIAAEERTCTLELKVRALEKRVFFEDGAPVGCQSNLLHELLGKFLVSRGKLTEEQYQKALLETVETGKPMGELLVARGLLSAFDLYKQLQANLAHKILDAFRWTEARYRLLADAEFNDTPVRMNAAQLVLTGTTTFLPFDVVATHLAFVDEQRFAVVADPPPGARDLKLSARDARLMGVLRGRPTFAELCAQTGLQMEEGLRKLYALCVLRLVDLGEGVDAAPPAEPAPPEAPSQASPAPAAPSEDPALGEALVTAFMAHRGLDPFDLLGVPVDCQPLALRRAFLARADRFAPTRFQAPELREKAEALLVAYARAYGLLSEPDAAAVQRRRREVAAEAARAARPTTADQFRIRTELLDGQTQFDQAREKLEQGDPRAAIELFQYACDIEPRPRYRAYLAHARYRAEARYARLALSELAEVTRTEPGCDEAHLFAAQIHQAEGRFQEAEVCYRLAYKAKPSHRPYADLALEMLRLAKARR